jgi:hypothetical protein
MDFGPFPSSFVAERARSRSTRGPSRIAVRGLS